MRTAKCTSCDAEVSLNATTCYNCGNNIAGEKKFVKWVIILFIVAVVYVEFIDTKSNNNNSTKQTISKDK